ncbi:hypothetical protein QUB68_13590 [Microcoleus sp. A006_D1]
MGCAAGKFPKPDLAALAVACGGVGMIVAMALNRGERPALNRGERYARQ